MRLLGSLASPRAHVAVVVVSLALLSPALAGELLLDDHVLALKARTQTTVAGLHAEPLVLFRFTTGAPEDNRALMDGGVLLPWWSEPHHRNAFFRPLSSLTHLLDFALWPRSPWLMHAHSLFWYALLLLAVSHAYRRLSPAAPAGPCAATQTGALAGTSLLLFALDDAHGATVGWIANRNALVAAALALPALALHHRARAQGYRPGLWLGALCFALGLCAGETALSIFGYLVAYALCIDRGTPRQRMTALVPYVLVLAAHRGLYRAFGLGSFGSSAYHDPLHEPVAFIASLAYNLPVLLSAQLGAPLADFAFWGDPSMRPWLLALSVGTLALLSAALRPLLERDAYARFWAVGMVLSAIPLCASLPGERLLLCVGLGAFPLVARFLWLVSEHDAAVLGGGLGRAVRTVVAAGLVLAHLVVAPLLLPVRAHAIEFVGAIARRLDASVSTGPEIENQRVVLVNAPITVAASYLQVMRASRGARRPLGVHWLTSASSALTVTRTADRTLRLSLAQGFLRRSEETHYRADVFALGLGARVALGAFDARVVALTDDGRPKTVDFTFAHPLDSTRYRFLCYRDGAFLQWRPPSLGTIVHFPAQDFFEIVGDEAMR